MHSRKVCVCHKVIEQCRCPGPHNIVTVDHCVHESPMVLIGRLWYDGWNVAAMVLENDVWVPYGESVIADPLGDYLVDAVCEDWPEGHYHFVDSSLKFLFK